MSIRQRMFTNADEARRAGDFIIQIRDESERVVYVSSEIATALKEQTTARELIANQIEKHRFNERGKYCGNRGGEGRIGGSQTLVVRIVSAGRKVQSSARRCVNGVQFGDVIVDRELRPQCKS